ncbi:hypothetical protein AB833_00600 [Chromatiales bacterium (ex Bugula neritina AB1)]|nr:hypothetical protein AB833_00600 [Chromatiales bacterium (ex Bugula neritina AB1)]
MQYMVIETIKPNSIQLVYERFHREGRMLPNGLIYLDSWLEDQGNRCFQLMETDDARLFDQWIIHWADLVSFEVIKLGTKPE